MKKNLLIIFALLSFFYNNAQKVVDTTGVLKDSYNRWSIEFSVGQAKGLRPFEEGYYSSNPGRLFGGVQANSYDLGTRYMLSPKFGLKLDLGYDKFTDQAGSGSFDFETYQYRVGFQGVINAIRLFNIEDAVGRFGLLLHGGIQVTRMHSKILDLDELNGGLQVGFSPQFRISNSISVFGDISLFNNFRQHFNWNGTNSDPSNNLSGQMVITSLGLSYSFGHEKIHGDWAIIMDKKDKEIKDLNNRIGEIETLMNDSDKDGVPDYLDVENNSITGVAVDTKGRMVDKNNNGVPDELEKYIDKSITTSNASNNSTFSKGMLEQLINDGYVAAYFDTNKTQPTNASTDNIGFILNYLRNNPEKSIDLIGYADELGSSSYNTKLSSDRAENIKAILTKAGIDVSRLNIVGNGIDSSVDKKSAYARRLVRKVVFKIK